ncbi:MAG: site-specific DNA-methyltransferase [Chloroflexi bacterium]|nr:site-specific DNA-methyltransferase [Chloroflexota bacterium]
MATGIPKTKWSGNGATPSTSNIPENAPDVFLFYKGKSSERNILATKPADTQILWQGSQAIRNRLYYGDNLPILASLLYDSSIQGKVRLVYIDPPFATKSVFQSRSQADAYSDLLAGAHYIEFIRERLVLLRELLAEDGSIYIHLDENMAFHIKIILDEVFGQSNFRNWITRKKCNPKNYTRKTYGNISDYILFYTKSDNYIWNRPYEEWTPERAEKEYQYIEEETGRRYKKVPIHAPSVRNGETGKPWQGMNPPPGKHWQFPPKTLDKMNARGEIYWSPNGNPRRKIYLDESAGVPVQDIWLNFRDAHNQNIKITGYPTEKNPDLLAQIIQASSNPGDMVLDCFAGSGTTLAVASQLGRNWIGIDNSPEAITTTLRRFATGLERMGDFVNVSQSSNNDDPLQPTLPLFSSLESPGHDHLTHVRQNVIKDFSLYISEPYSEELEDILEQWRAWQ